MTAQLQFKRSGTVVTNPISTTQSVSITLTVKNIGTSTATNVGFYIKESTYDPEVEIGSVYPSTRGASTDYAEILAWGALTTGSYGYSIVQGLVSTTCKVGLGDSAANAISMTVGTTAGQLAPDEEVTITVVVVPPPTETSHRKYVDLDATYS